LRRDFHDVWQGSGSALAKEALDRIGALYDIERAINGKSPEQRLTVRNVESRPRVMAFHAWCDMQLARISAKGALAKAIRYALNRWTAFTLFLEDGRVAIDNNAAERAMRPVCIGRKNYLFAGSDAGGNNIADAMTLIESAKLAGLNPQTYLTDTLARISEHKINRLDIATLELAVSHDSARTRRLSNVALSGRLPRACDFGGNYARIRFLLFPMCFLRRFSGREKPACSGGFCV